MNTPGIEFGRKTSAAYAALCKPLCQKLHLPQTAFDILMFLANNPGYQTASDVVEVRKLKANLVSVNVDRLVQEGYLIRDGKIASPVRGASLIGKGEQILMRIDRVGRHMTMGQGMCGSLSGSVPTNVGQPTIRVSSLTVGGK